MPTNIRMIHTQDFIRARPDRTLDFAASYHLLKNLVTEFYTAGSYHVLVDTREAHVRLSTTEIFNLAVAMTDEPAFGGKKFAVLVRPEEKVNADFFETVTNNRGRIVRAFTDFEIAITWLIMDWSVS